MSAFCFGLGWANNAGLLSIGYRDLTVHFLVNKPRRRWGYHEMWCDGPFPMVGLGPLLLVCWMGTLREALSADP